MEGYVGREIFKRNFPLVTCGLISMARLSLLNASGKDLHMCKRLSLRLNLLFLLIIFGAGGNVVHGQEPVEAEAAAQEIKAMIQIIGSWLGFEIEPAHVAPTVISPGMPMGRPDPISGGLSTGVPDWLGTPYTPKLPPTLKDTDPLSPYLSPGRGTRLGYPGPHGEVIMPPSAEAQLAAPQIKRYQLMLNNFGYNVGVPDGVIGPRTRKAVSELQGDNGYYLMGSYSPEDLFRTSGKLDERTQSLLNFLNDLTIVAKRFLKLDASSRDSIIDQSKVLRGYAESSDGIDLYLRPRDDDRALDFFRHFGPSDFEILRLHVRSKRQKFEFLSRHEAATAFDAYCGAFLKLYSTPEMRLVTARRNETIVKGQRVFTYQVRTPEGLFDLSPADVRKLRKGQPLPDTHPLTREVRNAKGALVFWSHPLMKGTRGELIQVEDLAFNVQRSYPSARIYRDDFQPGVTEKKTAALTNFKIRGAEDLTVVLDDTSTITHWSIMEDIREHLEAAHVHVIDYKPGIKWEGARGKAVIVITGHIDMALYKLVRQLIEDGYFRDNYVLFNACSGPLSTKLVAELNQKGGAVATFHFQGKISRPEVQTLMLKVLEKVDGKEPFTLMELSPQILNSPLKGIWVLCENTGGRSRDDRS